MQTQNGKPASRPLLIPTMVNSPKPIASNRNRVCLHRNIRFLNNNVTPKATAVVMKYFESSIQKGVTPSSRSRVVPPPMAVTKPTMYAPNQSMSFPEARRIPLIAKAKVPIRSKMVVIFPSASMYRVLNIVSKVKILIIHTFSYTLMVGLRIRIAALICISIGFACQPPPRPAHPNILFIMADDLGYGDVYAFNPGSSIPTPHIDRLASQGLSFTNAHAPASVCTPTRYSLLTGRYSWRSNRKKGVTWVWEGPMIDSGRYTIGTMLQTAGYHTACIGKWHLGLDWPTRDGLPASLENQGKNVDYSSPIKNGPTERGFDYYFGQEVPSFPPHAFIENERVTVEPSEWLQAGEGGIPGAKAPGW